MSVRIGELVVDKAGRIKASHSSQRLGLVIGVEIDVLPERQGLPLWASSVLARRSCSQDFAFASSRDYEPEGRGENHRYLDTLARRIREYTTYLVAGLVATTA